MRRLSPASPSLLGLALALCAAVSARAAAPESVRAEARAIFAAAVGFETSEGKAQVPRLAGFLAERFRAAGFAADDVQVIPHGETAAMLVRYRGSGGGRPVLLLAHLDVVPARTEDWERPPFELIEEGGYFFGRGAFDNKADLALLTATFLRLASEGFVPSRDLVLAFSGDEETQMATTRLLAAKARELYAPEYALNSDGGSGVLDEETGAPLVYYVQGAEKSYATFELTARNPGGHSSQPRDDNAIYDLAAALLALKAHRFPVMWNDWTLGSFRASAAATPGPLGDAIRRFAADPRDASAAEALAANPQHVGRTRTTCVATMLNAGHAENALPQSASATVNCRIFPGQSVDEVHQTLQRIAGPQLSLRVIGTPIGSDPSPLREDVMRAVTRAVHAARPGVPIVPDMAPYATDGAIYRAAGIPTYGVSSVFLKGSDEFAHGLNERIPVASFYAGLEHWYALLKSVAQ
jgi:acetylornithine deacetylase/succinyl-diaminopimelate desuccinylase-like protein